MTCEVFARGSHSSLLPARRMDEELRARDPKRYPWEVPGCS